LIPFAETTLAGNLGIIGILILLEGLLSADNALVIALLVKHLPPRQRRNALLVGLVGSFTFRLAAIFLAKHLINFWYLQLLGALYLLYLPLKHFLLKHAEKKVDYIAKPRKIPGFWQTVVIVEFTDLVFAVDSILVAVTLSKEMWIVWIGGISGVVLLRFAAFILVRMLEKYPGLEHMAYALVAWVGVKLAFMSAHAFHLSTGQGPEFKELNPYIFWGGMAVILGVGIWQSRRTAVEPPEQEVVEAAVEIEEAQSLR